MINIFWVCFYRRNHRHLQRTGIHYGGLIGAFGEVPGIVLLGPTFPMRTHFKLGCVGPHGIGNVQKKAMALKSANKKVYLQQLVDALHYMHKKGWIHMELSLDTVLVRAEL